MAIYALGSQVPSIASTAFVHPEAVIIGSVTIGDESSIWPGAILRGDRGRIQIGNQTSIQDSAIIHCNANFNTIVGNRCVIGHGAHLEGCTIHDMSLIGSLAVVLQGAEVGPVSLVGAHALVGNFKKVPSNARALGIPAHITHNVIHETDIDPAVEVYVNNCSWYRENLRRID